MQRPFFSIIVVSLNPGERLRKTLDSIRSQSFGDYEVIVKDGGSKDSSLKQLQEEGYFEQDKRFRVIEKKDSGIYDGMNQAISYCRGQYVQFLNCGDLFYSPKVLEEVFSCITGQDGQKAAESLQEKQEEKKDSPAIYYGNQYNQIQKTIVYSAPKINDFTCYRNVPCHQVCFYDSRLFQKRGYELSYKVRADYEHFLYSIYEEGARGISIPVVVASYEGGGFSETKENRRCSANEHNRIVKKYLGMKKACWYRLLMWLTLAPVRTKIAESPRLSKGYHKLKNWLYGMNNG